MVEMAQNERRMGNKLPSRTVPKVVSSRPVGSEGGGVSNRLIDERTT